MALRTSSKLHRDASGKLELPPTAVATAPMVPADGPLPHSSPAAEPQTTH